jgi:pyruvate carboxylase subunit B
VKYTVEIAGRSLLVQEQDGKLTVDGKPVEARLDGLPGSAIRRLVGGRGSREFVAVRGESRGEWRLLTDGQRLEATVLDDKALLVRAAARASGGGRTAGTLKAPMPGLVVRLLAAIGDEVPAGKGLLVVEAMKMENEFKAPGAGTVAKIFVKPGDRVEKGAPLVELA